MSENPIENPIRYLGDLQRLALQPGDRLVLTVKGRLSTEAALRIRNQLWAFLGDEIPVIVLEEGMTLGAVSAPVPVPERTW